jgi:hypothetical protein
MKLAFWRYIIEDIGFGVLSSSCEEFYLVGYNAM